MPLKGILVDSGPLVALLNERDAYHKLCLTQSQQLRGSFHTSWAVVTEAAHLLKSRPVAVQRLLSWVQTGEIRILQLDASDVQYLAQILLRYEDQSFDFADATLMHLGEREELSTVFTLDHRHFSVYRTKRRTSLVVVPMPSDS